MNPNSFPNHLRLKLCGFFQTGGYTIANYVWDLMQNRRITPSLPAVEAYYKGLKVSSDFAILWLVCLIHPRITHDIVSLYCIE